MEGWARNLGLGAALAFAIVPAQGFAQSRDSFHDLLAAYRCEVVHRLEQVYATGNPAIDRDRFIAVTVPGHPHGYVQCIFHDHQTGVYCEVSSGFYYAKKGQPRTFHQSSNAITALAKLGFDMDDSKGNFKTDMSVADPPNFNAIADFMLRALHDGYGARRHEFGIQCAVRTPHAVDLYTGQLTRRAQIVRW